MYVTPRHSNVTIVTLVDSSALEKFFYSNFPRESSDSKLTFPDQRIKNSSLYLWINRCMIY